jgi:hypothetical protein
MTYKSPVDQLLTLGKATGGRVPENWPDYPGLYGLTEEHIPELIRMATDKALNRAATDSLEVWAPVHAWRAIGQLGAQEAIEPLIEVIRQGEDDEWIWEEIPMVYSLLGPAAIPTLAQYISDNAPELSTTLTAAVALEEIVKRHPDARQACVPLVIAQLEKYKENDPGVNAYLIVVLLECGAKEALPLIEKAFAANAVDEMMMGDWEDVQVEFGVKEPDPNRERKPPPWAKEMAEAMDKLASIAALEEQDTPPKPTGRAKQRTKAKKKRRQAQKSRQRNRKR